MSRLDLVAGPNGGGKTTFYEHVIAPLRPGLPFVNADRIAHARFPGHEMDRAYEAARIADTTRQALLDARLDFCTETVFSHRSKADLIRSAVGAGYDVVLHVLLIPLQLSGPRVAARVANGGHNVPEDKLATRYARIWPNIVDVMPRCYRSVFYDNSTDDGPFEVAAYRYGMADYPPHWPAWAPKALLALTQVA